MSWKVVSAMEQRVRMMAQWESGAESVAELCRRYGISRKTAYKWWVRWREQGVEGLAERSRAPQRQAQRIAPAWERAVVEARTPSRRRQTAAVVAGEWSGPDRWAPWRLPNQARASSASSIGNGPPGS